MKAAALFDVQQSQCIRCGRVWIGADTDPDHLCGQCATCIAGKVADVVLAYRPKAKQPKPRKRKKAKRVQQISA